MAKKESSGTERFRPFVPVVVLLLAVVAHFFYQLTGEPAKDPYQDARHPLALEMEKDVKPWLQAEKSLSDLHASIARGEVKSIGVVPSGLLLVSDTSDKRYYVRIGRWVNPSEMLKAVPEGKQVQLVVLDASMVIPENIGVPPAPKTAGSVIGEIGAGIGLFMFQALPLILNVVILFFLVTFLKQRKAKFEPAQKPNVSFADVIGAEEAKAALADVVQYLKNPQEYTRLGAKAPRGVLMMGPPGTGKTLLAKALAGECGVSFIAANGSSFTSPLVGAGVSKVKDLFERAKKTAPCVVFLDEIDGLGNRDSGSNTAVDTENGRIVSEFLTQMNGFNDAEGIIVVAATNFPERIDAALLRDGRFDKKCPLFLPDVKEREELFAMYATKVRCAPGVSFGRLARASAGMSPAGIENTVISAARLATRGQKSEVSEEDMLRALEGLQLGEENSATKRAMNSGLRERIAAHEAGHAIVATVYNLGTVDKVTIIPRTKALGVTLVTQEQQRLLATPDECEHQIQMLLAGREAERMVFGNVSTGAANDLERASAIAFAMVTEYGFSDDFGCFSLKAIGHDRGVFLQERAYAQARAILETASQRCAELLATHRKGLDQLSQELLKHETVDADMVTLCVHGRISV